MGWVGGGISFQYILHGWSVRSTSSIYKAYMFVFLYTVNFLNKSADNKKEGKKLTRSLIFTKIIAVIARR